MRARLSFGLSMAFLFDVYLVDELTSVGDAIFRAKAKKAFDDMRDRASLIFVSHNLQTLRESCQSALFLHEGSAAFFPNIEDGILAYQEFIRSDRDNHEQEIRGLKKAKRLEMRRRKLEKLQRATSDESQPNA
jgi:capsular polysaccharide transport system ATP-binding protein